MWHYRGRGRKLGNRLLRLQQFGSIGKAVSVHAGSLDDRDRGVETIEADVQIE